MLPSVYISNILTVQRYHFSRGVISILATGSVQNINEGVSRLLVLGAVNSNMIRHELLNKEPFHSRYAPFQTWDVWILDISFLCVQIWRMLLKIVRMILAATPVTPRLLHIDCENKIEYTANWVQCWFLLEVWMHQLILP